MRDDEERPFVELAPEGLARIPVVLSSPHSGTSFPLEGTASVAVSQWDLTHLDDGPTDSLAASCCEVGATVLCARYARAFVDLNRSPLEIDPAHLDREDLPANANVTPKVEVGLGIIPSRIAGRLIYRTPLGLLAMAARLRRAYYPYHERLRTLMQANIAAAGGACVLLDCHSMPAEAAKLDNRCRTIDVTVGDRFGASAHPALVNAAIRSLTEAGLMVTRNRPYAGGFITEHYGKPHIGWHAIQLEFRRDLFFDRHSRALSANANDLSEALCRSVLAINDALASVYGSGFTVEPHRHWDGIPLPASWAAD